MSKAARSSKTSIWPEATKWMIIPAVLFTLIMTGFPLLYAIFLSLNHFLFGSHARFVGVQNYIRMFHNPVFWYGLLVTFVLYFIALAAELVLGTYIGLLLHKKLAGVRVLRTVLLAPFAMPPVVVGMMWLILLDPSFGVVNYLLSSIGLDKGLFLASPTWVVPTLAAIDTWQWTPFIALIVLGGLQTLPVEPYEAALLEGASRLQILRHITLPLLRPTLVTAAILRSVDLLRFFDTIYITTQGGPVHASTTLNIYAYQEGFVYFKIGYASSVMITLFVLVIVTVMGLTLLRKSVAY